MKLQRQLCNGRWIDCSTDESRLYFLDRAAKLNNITRKEALDLLKEGKSLKHGPDWYSELRDIESIERIEQQKPKVEVEMVECSCGCTVPKNLVMSASMGSSCPDCYDEMSE